MRSLKRTAMGAVLSFAAATALSGSGIASAFGAADIVEAENSSLLPVSVYETAAQEGQTPVDYTIIPDVPVDAGAEEGAAQAASLAGLVSLHMRATTVSREEECLAGTIYFESKGEPLEGQLAVAQVVLNRARSGRFASSVCGVVFQPGQFSFVRGGGFPHIARNSRSWREAVAVAEIALGDLWDSRASNALYFHARHVSPGWRMSRVATIGNHIFYR